jgi:hypothetical protein
MGCRGTKRAWGLFFVFGLAAGAEPAGRAAVVTIRVNGSAAQGPLPRYEYRVIPASNSPLAPGDKARLQEIPVRMTRKFLEFDVAPQNQWCPSEGVYAFGFYEARLQEIVSYGSSPWLVFDGTPAWLADTSATGGVYSPRNPPRDFAKYETMIFDGLSYFKGRFPQITWVEAWNEPNLRSMSQSVFHEVYRRTANAVARVNARLPAGVAKLKLGGPAVTYGARSWIPGFLDFCRANRLPLDFVSWHNFNATAPAGYTSDVTQVRGWLSSRGMAAPISVSAYGADGTDNTLVTPSALAFKAAALAAQNYFYIQGGLEDAVLFSVRSVTKPSFSILAPVEGRVNPVYNVLKMNTMMKRERVSATSDGLASNGTGVGALASSDGTGLTVLVWNYNGASSTASVAIGNLPGIFAGRTVRVQRYVVDATRSNYAYDPAKDRLEKVEDFTLSPRTTVTASVPLATNSVSLLVLSPVGATGNMAPATVLTTPSDGATFAAGADVPLAADASDGDGTIRQVEFFEGTRLLASDDTPPYAFTWPGVPEGTYTLTSRATDDQGGVGTSAPVNLTVGPGGLAVTVEGVSTGRSYAIGRASPGARPYTDRSRTVVAIDPALEGGLLVRTANDDKEVRTPELLTLSVNRPAVLYVCYDRRAARLPAWLDDGTWSVLPATAETSNRAPSPYRVLSKSVAEGPVTLGGNLAGRETGARANYFAVLQPAGGGGTGIAEFPGSWVHPGDADGDGLGDGFEASQGLDPAEVDSDGDGDEDEEELTPGGETLWQEQERTLPSSGGSGGGGCGATGLEVLALVGYARARRRRGPAEP